MGRQKKTRTVESPPKNFRFSADSKKCNSTPEESTVIMRLDEFEVIRLVDKNGYDHAKAAEIMGISRPTVTKLLNKARGKLSELIIDGKTLIITGGSILFSEDVYCCKICKRPFKRESNEPLICPICQSTEIIKAREDCNGDCHCCEDDIG